LKNINAVPLNMPLAEMGMDSMMALEIKQTLEREFDISLTAQDIRTLSFTKLREMTIIIEQGKHDINKINENNMEGLSTLIRKLETYSYLVSDVLVELVTKKGINKSNIFLLPGIEGCSDVYESIASRIKFSATCLQHCVLNSSNQISVMKSADYLLPVCFK